MKRVSRFKATSWTMLEGEIRAFVEEDEDRDGLRIWRWTVHRIKGEDSLRRWVHVESGASFKSAGAARSASRRVVRNIQRAAT